MPIVLVYVQSVNVIDTVVCRLEEVVVTLVRDDLLHWIVSPLIEQSGLFERGWKEGLIIDGLENRLSLKNVLLQLTNDSVCPRPPTMLPYRVFSPVSILVSVRIHWVVNLLSLAKLYGAEAVVLIFTKRHFLIVSE